MSKRGASLVAISVDPVSKSRDLASRLGLAFPILSDPDRSVVRSFGVEDAENGIAWPAVFVLARDGIVRWRALSATYKVRPSVGDIEAALDRLAAP